MILATLFSSLLARAALWATRIFYDIGRQGPELPDGPILVVANHPNSIMDALVIFTVAGRPVSPLARAPLFDRPFIGAVLRELGGLPVYRPQDQLQLVGRNEATFDAAIEALRGGAAVLIFPEGTSHSETALAPLRTGAARIALRAEQDSQWQLGLRIVPVGLTYRRKTRFRGQAAVCVGEPLPVLPWCESFRSDAASTVHRLTDAIASALEDVTVQLSRREFEPLLDAAEALYAAEHRLAGADGEPALAERLPRLQLLASGMNWLQAHDPERLQRLVRAVRTYRQRLARLGLRGSELPERHSFGDFVRWLGVDGLLSLLGLPIVAAGIVAWYVPYALPRLVVLVHRPVYEARATVKLVTALVTFPMAYASWLWFAWEQGGRGAVALTAFLLPLIGLVTLHWREHWSDFRRDLLFFWRATRRRELPQALRARRTSITAEIDRIADEWEAETQRRIPDRPAPR